MHITSLPSPYGIGTLGREAYRFADFLRRAAQTYWQILPDRSHGVCGFSVSVLFHLCGQSLSDRSGYIRGMRGCSTVQNTCIMIGETTRRQLTTERSTQNAEKCWRQRRTDSSSCRRKDFVRFAEKTPLGWITMRCLWRLRRLTAARRGRIGRAGCAGAMR